MILGLGLLWAPLVSASPYTDAEDLLNSGQYVAAQQAAEQLDTGLGYALAAKAVLAEIMLGQSEDLKARADEAVSLAEKAVALAPDNYDANIQYAVAFGVKTRLSSIITAWRKKSAARTYSLIQDLRTTFPDTARGDALLGAWHLAVVRKAGAKNARKMYGANISDGAAVYTLALKSQEDYILIAGNYALSLYVLNPSAYEETSRQLLEWVATRDPQNALDRALQVRMASILAAFSDPETAQEMAEDFLDGKAP